MLNFNSFSLAALVGLAAVMSSCSIKEERDECPQFKSNVLVDVRTFEYEMTKASSASEAAIQRLAFKAFDASGKVAFDTTEVAGTVGFGTVACRLSPGTYTFVAVGHKVMDSAADSCAIITSAAKAEFPSDKIDETFSGTSTVTVQPGVDFSTGMTLPRQVAKLLFKTNDVVPSNVARMEVVVNSTASSVSTLPSFNPATGLALADRSYKRSYDLTSVAGKKWLQLNIFLFLTSVEQTVTAVATAYDKDGNVVISHTLTGIPLKQNRITTASGEFFSASGSGSFLFNTDWDSSATVSY